MEWVKNHIKASKSIVFLMQQHIRRGAQWWAGAYKSHGICDALNRVVLIGHLYVTSSGYELVYLHVRNNYAILGAVEFSRCSFCTRSVSTYMKGICLRR